MNFDILNYIRQYLHAGLRKPRILQFLQGLAYPLHQLFTNFADWRVQQYYDVNISGQTYALQEHLNTLFDNTLRRILIKHYNDQAVYFPLSTEGYSGVFISLESENAGIFIALEGEIQQTIGVSFQVWIPSTINQELVISELMKYKLAGKSFEIIVN